MGQACYFKIQKIVLDILTEIGKNTRKKEIRYMNYLDFAILDITLYLSSILSLVNRFKKKKNMLQILK